MSRFTRRSFWVGSFLFLLLSIGTLAVLFWVKSADRSLVVAREAYAKGDWEAARVAARERLERAPNDVAAWRLLARSAARAGRAESAHSIYKERVTMERMEAEDFFLMSLGLSRARQNAAAIAVLQRGLKADPRAPDLLQELSRLAAAEGGLGQAAKFAKRLAEIPGWEARGSVMLGALHAEMFNPSETAKNLDRALKLDPNLKGAVTTPLKARKLLARALLKLGKPADAEAHLKQVLAAGPDPEGSWLLGRGFLQQGRIKDATIAQDDSIGYGDESIFAHEPAPFVGSARCAPCHQTIHETQQSSLHSKTFFATADLGKIALPEKPVADRFAPGVVHTLKRDGEQVKAETRIDGEVFRAVVDYAIGSGDRGLTFVGHDDKKQAREIRLSKYNDGSGWDLTIGQNPIASRPDHYLGYPLSRDEVYGCVNCHTTDGRAAIEKLEPLVADHGIGCERCHGPGANHLKAVEGKFTELAIGRPRNFSADRLVKMCAQCHSPIGNAVLNPEDKSTLRFQAVHFVKSRCYTESNGRLSCITCHGPHRDAESSTRYYELKCLACHSPGAEAVVGADPSNGLDKQTPCPINASKDCLKCHMPVEKTAIPHATFSDHYIRVHRDTPLAVHHERRSGPPTPPGQFRQKSGKN